MIMKKFIIRDRESGNFIDEFDTYQEAKKELQRYESEDNQEESYTEDFYEIVEREYTYDVVFNDDTDSNSKGFAESYEYCFSYIMHNNGTNESYFSDYKGGIVSIVCNETEETVYEEEIR
jgi:hypothetical protein